jgi:hypothetical protein
MRVRIYQPAKTAMQSGRGNSRKWLMEFEPAARRAIDPLMGWTSSPDTRAQVKLYFDTAEEAIAHARRQGFAYTVDKPHDRAIRPKSYSDNFRSDRFGNWTH